MAIGHTVAAHSREVVDYIVLVVVHMAVAVAHRVVAAVLHHTVGLDHSPYNCFLRLTFSNASLPSDRATSIPLEHADYKCNTHYQYMVACYSTQGIGHKGLMEWVTMHLSQVR